MPEFFYGKHATHEIIKSRSDLVRRLLVSRPGKYPEIESLAKKNGISVEEKTPNDLEQILRKYGIQGKLVVQGIVAELERLPLFDLEEVWNQIKKEQKTEPFLLLLDQIEDPHNMGSILRSALFFGVDAVIFPAHRSAAIGGSLAKTSSGALSWVKLVQVNNLHQTMLKLKDWGVTLLGADPAEGGDWGREDYRTADFCSPVALVVGGEGKGLRDLTKRSCDYLINIPGSGGPMASLNASVAAALLLAEVWRQRQEKS